MAFQFGTRKAADLLPSLRPLQWVSISPKGSPAFPASATFWISCLLYPHPPPQSWRGSLGFLEAEVILCSGSCPPWIVWLGLVMALAFKECVLQGVALGPFNSPNWSVCSAGEAETFDELLLVSEPQSPHPYNGNDANPSSSLSQKHEMMPVKHLMSCQVHGGH